jgi:hypothetical protein
VCAPRTAARDRRGPHSLKPKPLTNREKCFNGINGMLSSLDTSSQQQITAILTELAETAAAAIDASIVEAFHQCSRFRRIVRCRRDSGDGNHRFGR